MLALAHTFIATYKALTRQPTLKGHCMLVSLIAEEYLNKYQADNRFWEAVSSDTPCFNTAWGGHAWLLGTDAANGVLVLDLTADQYGQATPYVHPWPDANYPAGFSAKDVAYLRTTTAYSEMKAALVQPMAAQGYP